jgi:hypothetical protein
MSQIMMIQPDAQKVDKPSDKAVGANRETNWTLVQMAKNAVHYIQLAGRWEAGKTDVRKAKKRFEELKDEEKALPDTYTTDAWRNRPYGCNDLRKAIDLYGKHLDKARKNIFTNLRLTGMTHLEINTTIVAATAALDEKIAGLKRAVAALDARKVSSRIQEEFPGSGGFLKQQAVSAKLREWEQRAGGPMDMKERKQKFPELEPGWPDIQGDEMPLPFEKELQVNEKARAQEQLESCNKILNAALKKQRQAEVEKQKMLSKTVPSKKPVDRRHNPQPDGAEVRYVVQPGQKRPAPAASAAQSMPRNEGEVPQKKQKIAVDSDSEDGEDDGAGAIPPPARKQQKRSESPSLAMAERSEPFVAPDGQGPAYDILFRDEEDDDDEPAPPPRSARASRARVESDHEISDMDSDDDE